MSKRYDHYMILTRTPPRQVLLLAAEQGYVTPEWEPDPNFWVQHLAREINTFAGAALGLPVTLLETRVGTEFKSNGRRIKAYFLEGHDLAWQSPSGSLWAGPSDLETVRLTIPELKPLLQSWLSGPPAVLPGQPPVPEWTQPGWLAEVNAWVDEKLARQGVRLAGKPEQLKSWSISCLLRFPTDRGDYFFKATPPVFQKEPFFMAFLAEHFPGHIPQIAAIEAERGWMLMPDFQATNLREVDDISMWEAAARRYARLQKASAGLAATLLEKGVRDRRLERLGDQVAAVVADTPRLVPDPETGLTPDELQKLRDLVPVLREIIAELAGLGLPTTLIHGDLNTNNIALNASGRFIYYDWTDLSISHPFIDLDAFFEWGSPFDKTIPDWENRVRQAYLEVWNDLLPQEQLRRALVLSTPLAMMVQGLNYYWIVTRTDQSGSDDFGSAVPYYFRRLLEYMAEHSPA